MSDIQFEPVARRTVAEEVRQAIAARITSRELEPGSQLPSERLLCEQFGVARTSVREAIQGLVMLGLIERRANRAYVVEHLPTVQLDGNDGRKRRVRELFEVRQVVEIPIARLATCRASTRIVNGSWSSPRRSSPTCRSRSSVASTGRSTGRSHARAATRRSPSSTARFSHPCSGRVSSTSCSARQSNRRVVREIIRSASEAHRAIAEGIANGEWSAVVGAAEHHLDQVEDQMISKMV